MISWVAMDRIVERKIASDAEYRKLAAQRPLRSNAKVFTDGELLAKLRGFGIDLDRSSLERLCEQALSAEEIARPLLDQRTLKTKRQELESDWIWICLAALWQRWFPDKPCFELLDDKMQAGYMLRAAGSATAACRIWLEAWTDVLGLLDKARIPSISEFDRRFRGTQSLFNWIQELEDELWNAGLEDRRFLTARIAVCEEGLRRFPSDDDLLTQNRRRALAESYYELGQTDTAEALYREWLKADPRWGWGWIGWSDCYRFSRTQLRDLQRSEQLLQEGLSIAEVRDRARLAERLADLCEEQGRGEEAKECRQQTTFEDKGPPLNELSNGAAIVRLNSSQAAARRQKVGRNQPCPCGSGKKFKKCCGGGLSRSEHSGARTSTTPVEP